MLRFIYLSPHQSKWREKLWPYPTHQLAIVGSPRLVSIKAYCLPSPREYSSRSQEGDCACSTLRAASCLNKRLNFQIPGYRDCSRAMAFEICLGTFRLRSFDLIPASAVDVGILDHRTLAVTQATPYPRQRKRAPQFLMPMWDAFEDLSTIALAPDRLRKLPISRPAHKRHYPKAIPRYTIISAGIGHQSPYSPVSLNRGMIIATGQ
jgi:hypothetical protein